MTETNTPSRRLGRSVVAILLGFVAIVVLSLGTDVIMHKLEIYPPFPEPMTENSDNLLALAYRCVYGVLGSYIAARLAPYKPMRHALILGFIGLFLSTIGAIAAFKMNMGPMWYPISLVLTTLPMAWLGGVVYRPRTNLT